MIIKRKKKVPTEFSKTSTVKYKLHAPVYKVHDCWKKILNDLNAVNK
jgi:hypothetical protein